MYRPGWPTTLDSNLQQKRPGYLPGLAGIKKALLKTRVLDFIPFGSPNRIIGKTFEKTFALVY